MKTLKVYPDSINDRHIDIAVDALRDGHMVIYPTDTLYGIGVDALNNKAIEKICRLKDINPAKNTLAIVCEDISSAAQYARIDNPAFRILKQYLPGPYTFILPASNSLPKIFKERKTVGIRIPDNAIAHALVQHLGTPLMTTSVFERHSDTDITNPESLAMTFDSEVAVTIDGGDTLTTPSTVVDLTDSSAPVVVRQGAGSFEE